MSRSGARTPYRSVLLDRLYQAPTYPYPLASFVKVSQQPPPSLARHFWAKHIPWELCSVVCSYKKACWNGPKKDDSSQVLNLSYFACHRHQIAACSFWQSSRTFLAFCPRPVSPDSALGRDGGACRRICSRVTRLDCVSCRTDLDPDPCLCLYLCFDLCDIVRKKMRKTTQVFVVPVKWTRKRCRDIFWSKQLLNMYRRLHKNKRCPTILRQCKVHLSDILWEEGHRKKRKKTAFTFFVHHAFLNHCTEQGLENNDVAGCLLEIQKITTTKVASFLRVHHITCEEIVSTRIKQKWHLKLISRSSEFYASW